MECGRVDNFVLINYFLFFQFLTYQWTAAHFGVYLFFFRLLVFFWCSVLFFKLNSESIYYLLTSKNNERKTLKSTFMVDRVGGLFWGGSAIQLSMLACLKHSTINKDVIIKVNKHIGISNSRGGLMVLHMIWYFNLRMENWGLFITFPDIPTSLLKTLTAVLTTAKVWCLRTTVKITKEEIAEKMVWSGAFLIHCFRFSFLYF